MAEITGNRPESCNGGYALNSRRGFFKFSIAALASLILGGYWKKNFQRSEERKDEVRSTT